jgi:hypothetical protein
MHPMQPREYDIMYELEENYWWHTGMMAIIACLPESPFESIFFLFFNLAEVSLGRK